MSLLGTGRLQSMDRNALLGVWSKALEGDASFLVPDEDTWERLGPGAQNFLKSKAWRDQQFQVLWNVMVGPYVQHPAFKKEFPVQTAQGKIKSSDLGGGTAMQIPVFGMVAGLWPGNKLYLARAGVGTGMARHPMDRLGLNDPYISYVVQTIQWIDRMLADGAQFVTALGGLESAVLPCGQGLSNEGVPDFEATCPIKACKDGAGLVGSGYFWVAPYPPNASILDPASSPTFECQTGLRAAAQQRNLNPNQMKRGTRKLTLPFWQIRDTSPFSTRDIDVLFPTTQSETVIDFVLSKIQEARAGASQALNMVRSALSAARGARRSKRALEHVERLVTRLEGINKALQKATDLEGALATSDLLKHAKPAHQDLQAAMVLIYRDPPVAYRVHSNLLKVYQGLGGVWTALKSVERPLGFLRNLAALEERVAGGRLQEQIEAFLRRRARISKMGSLFQRFVGVFGEGRRLLSEPGPAVEDITPALLSGKGTETQEIQAEPVGVPPALVAAQTVAARGQVQIQAPEVRPVVAQTLAATQEALRALEEAQRLRREAEDSALRAQAATARMAAGPGPTEERPSTIWVLLPVGLGLGALALLRGGK